VRRNNTYVTT